MFKLYDWFKSYSNFSGLDGLCLVLEFHQGGSVTNGATPSSEITTMFAYPDNGENLKIKRAFCGPN